MPECGKLVEPKGAGASYPCYVERGIRVSHEGPCAARENPRSLREREAWEKDQANLAVLRETQGEARPWHELHTEPGTMINHPDAVVSEDNGARHTASDPLPENAPELLIGLRGYAQAGKDTIGGLLVENYGFFRFAFADKLREWIFALDPLVDITNNEHVYLSQLVEASGWDVAKQHPEVRRALQRMGTELGRQYFGEDFWANNVFNQFQGDERAVITDVRFSNEAHRVKELGGFLVTVYRPGVGAVNSHASESLTVDPPSDFTIVNDGSVEDLQMEIKRVLGEILLSRLVM